MTEPTPLGLDLTRPEPVPAAGIERATQLMWSGRLFRYGEESQSSGEVSLLEQEAARLLGRRYAVAVNSCGAALFLALRVCGVRPGDEVLVNGYTLAPVPGAIEHAGARAVLVEVDDHLTIDLDDLRRKAAGSSARVLLLSHMRGHLADLPRVRALCDELGLLLVEDCAHTLGAAWASQPTGTFGEAACLSLQTFKHLNAGEGGLLLLDDDERAARAILHSGSYMHYAQHAARPPLEAFEPLRGEVANFSMRMSELAAAVARPQLPLLPDRVEAMNRSYRDLEHRLEQIPGVRVVPRRPEEQYVGSSSSSTCAVSTPSRWPRPWRPRAASAST